MATAQITLKSLLNYAWTQTVPTLTMKSYAAYGWAPVVPQATAGVLASYGWVPTVPQATMGNLGGFAWAAIPWLSVSSLGSYAWVPSANRPRLSGQSTYAWVSDIPQVFIGGISTFGWASQPNAPLVSGLSAFAWVPQTAQVAEGPLAAFGWVPQPPVVSLGTMEGYAWLAGKTNFPAWQRGDAAVMSLFQKVTNQTIPNNMITLGVPQATQDGSKKNTSIDITGNGAISPSGKSWTGTVTVFYNRVPIAKAFPTFDLLFVVGGQRGKTVALWDLLTLINQAYNMSLTGNDVDNAQIGVGANSIVLTVSATSYMFLPGSSVTLTLPSS